jgi:hypothetical protein
MSKIHEATRRFEMMFPEIGDQERLRATDPEKYEQHMNQLRNEPVDMGDCKIVAIIIYDPKNRTIRYEKPKKE